MYQLSLRWQVVRYVLSSFYHATLQPSFCLNYIVARKHLHIPRPPISSSIAPIWCLHVKHLPVDSRRPHIKAAFFAVARPTESVCLPDFFQLSCWAPNKAPNKFGYWRQTRKPLCTFHVAPKNVETALRSFRIIYRRTLMEHPICNRWALGNLLHQTEHDVADDLEWSHSM